MVQRKKTRKRTTKRKQPANTSNKPVYNPMDYGYEPEQLIEIPGQFIDSFFKFIEDVVKSQDTHKFRENSSGKLELVKGVDTTPLGVHARNMNRFIVEVHIRNIENGTAIHRLKLLKEEMKEIKKPEKEVSIKKEG